MSTAIPPLKVFKLPDQLLQRFSDEIAQTLGPLAQVPISNGQLATVTLTADVMPGAYFTLNHGLGRPLTGILPCAVPYKALATPQAGASFVLGPATSASDLTVNLLCSAALVKGNSLSFWVF